MEQVLGGFRPAEKVVDSYNAYYDHLKMKWQDTGDLELDDNGNPKWAGYRTDLRRTGGTDKKPVYSLQPSTEGLALGSKPDSKGNWQPVGATIDPAVLFIDRCLQLLKPGGRLMIVLPDGILCNSGDRYVREYILGKKDEQTGEFVGGKAIVKAVISLPSDCWYRCKNLDFVLTKTPRQPRSTRAVFAWATNRCLYGGSWNLRLCSEKQYWRL